MLHPNQSQDYDNRQEDEINIGDQIRPKQNMIITKNSGSIQQAQGSNITAHSVFQSKKNSLVTAAPQGTNTNSRAGGNGNSSNSKNRPDTSGKRRDSQGPANKVAGNVIKSSYGNSHHFSQQQQSPLSHSSKFSSSNHQTSVKQSHGQSSGSGILNMLSPTSSTSLKQASRNSQANKESGSRRQSKEPPSVQSTKNSNSSQNQQIQFSAAANKPYVNQRSPTGAISHFSSNLIMQQNASGVGQSNAMGGTSQHSRQQIIQTIPATLSPKDITSKLFIFKPGRQSPVNTATGATQIQLALSTVANKGLNIKGAVQQQQQQYQNMQFQQQQQSPLNQSQQQQRQQLQGKRSPQQQTVNSFISVKSQGSASATNQSLQQQQQLSGGAAGGNGAAYTLKTQSQIFQRVYELKKKYQNTAASTNNADQHDNMAPMSAPISHVTSPERRNENFMSNNLAIGAGGNVTNNSTNMTKNIMLNSSTYSNNNQSNISAVTSGQKVATPSSSTNKSVKQPTHNNFFITKPKELSSSQLLGSGSVHTPSHQYSSSNAHSAKVASHQHHPSSSGQIFNFLDATTLSQKEHLQNQAHDVMAQVIYSNNNNHSSATIGAGRGPMARRQSPPPQSNSNLINVTSISSQGGKSYNSNNQAVKNPKELIIQHIGKYIRRKQQSNETSQVPQFVQNNYFQQPPTMGYDDEEEGGALNEEILQNLREFLQYLEDKKIINTSKLENSKEEMNNLIKDLMKLDLTKFTKTKNASSSETTSTTTAYGHQRRGSASPNMGKGVNNNSNGSTTSNEVHKAAAQMQNAFQQRHNSQATILQQPQQYNVNMNRDITHSQILTDYITNINGQQSNRSNYNPHHQQDPSAVLISNHQYQQPQHTHHQHNNSNSSATNYNNQSQHSQQSSSSRQVPTIQLMINTNVNNYCITPANNTNSSPNTTNNANTAGSGFNNFSIYPGNPDKSQPQQQDIRKGSATGSSQGGNTIFHQRRGSESQALSSLLQKGAKLQQASNINPPQVAHKRNGSDANLLLNQQHNKGSQKQQQPQHRKNTPSMEPVGGAAMKGSSSSSALKIKPQEGGIASVESGDKGSNQRQPQLLHKSVIVNEQQHLKQSDDFEGSSSKKAAVVFNENNICEEREKISNFVSVYVKRHNEIPPTTLDYYKFVKLIGKGAFGKVTLGIHKLTGKYVAIKTIDKSYMKDEYSRRKVFQEVYILKKIRHSCVIRLLEVFESPKHFLMVMEYAGGGDLLQYVKKRRRLDEESAKAIFKQIVYGLGHCHCRSVLHRDIKLDNILMDGEGGVKLCDFGVSRLVKKNQMIKEQCGTPAYLAPEIIIDEGYEGFYADTWSLGVLLYAMLQGTVPFKANNIADLHKLILKGDFEFAVESISEESKDFIRRMLVLVPEQRISIPQMLNHPWLAEDQEGAEEDDEHDLKVGATFFRQECMNGITGGGAMESGNINYINVENLYYKCTAEVAKDAAQELSKDVENNATKEQTKMTYSDYCALTEDFMTYRIDEEAISIVESYGYPRKLVIDSINKGEINHATSCYYLLIHSTNQ